MAKASKAIKVFISHSCKDRKFVEQELIPLLDSHGIQSWYSSDKIRANCDWEKRIREGLKSCNWFLVVMSPQSKSSEWVRSEVNWAFENDKKDNIIPLLIKDCEPSEIYLKLKLIQYVDFRDRSNKAKAELLKIWNIDYPAKSISIAIANSKGGSGKSTTALHLAAGLGKRKKSTLLIDFDPQATVTSILHPSQQKVKSLQDLIKCRRVTTKTSETFFLPTNLPNVTLLGNNDSMYGAEEQIRKALFKEKLNRIRNRCHSNQFEYIVYDTPAGRGPLLRTALELSEYIVIPTDISPGSLRPLEGFLAYLKKHYKKCKILGVLVNQWKKQLSEKGIYEKYRELFDKHKVKPFFSMIDYSVKVIEAFEENTTVFAKRRNVVQRQLDDFVTSVLERIERDLAT